MERIELEDGIAKQLAADAAAKHLSVAEYLGALIDSAGTANRESIAAGSFDDELDALLFDGSATAGTFSRAEIYGEHP